MDCRRHEDLQQAVRVHVAALLLAPFQGPNRIMAQNALRTSGAADFFAQVSGVFAERQFLPGDITQKLLEGPVAGLREVDMAAWFGKQQSTLFVERLRAALAQPGSLTVHERMVNNVLTRIDKLLAEFAHLEPASNYDSLILKAKEQVASELDHMRIQRTNPERKLGEVITGAIEMAIWHTHVLLCGLGLNNVIERQHLVSFAGDIVHLLDPL